MEINLIILLLIVLIFPQIWLIPLAVIIYGIRYLVSIFKSLF